MQWIEKKNGAVMRVLLIAAVFMLLPISVYAAAPGNILAKGIGDGNIIVYIQDPETEEIEVQIGTQVCNNVAVTDGADEPIHTLFLLDNSLSIAEKYRPVINEVLTNIVASRSSNERFSIATYTEQLNYLIQDSGDYAAVKKTIDSIEYNSHESHLTPVLYDYFSSLAQSTPLEFHKIVVISDGASEEAIGYSFAELSDRIKSSPSPIYSIGVAYDNNGNKKELENLFSLSRLTKGEAWRINDISDTLDLAAAVASGSAIKKVTVVPPAEMCDGTEKGIRVSAGTYSDQTTVIMPFGRQQAAEEASTQSEPPKPAEVAPQAPVYTQSAPTAQESTFPVGIVAAVAAVIIVGGIVGFVLAKKKKGEKAEQGKLSDDDTSAVRPNPVFEDNDVTEYASSSSDNDTALVFSARKRIPTLVLTDVGDPNRRYKAPLTDDIAVGRRSDQGCKIVIPDQSVSKKHCIFSYTRGVLYVTDAGSKNGTLIDGEEISGNARVEDGSRITLGDVELRVEIKDA